MKAQRYTFGWSHVYAYFLLYIWYFQSSWKWFIYAGAQNVNRKYSDDGPPKKKSKFDSMKKHECPPIPSSATDKVSDERNMRLLKEEWSKTKQVADTTIKELFMRTHAMRRTVMFSSDYTGVGSILHEFPMLKRCTYVSSRYYHSYLLFIFRLSWNLN